MELSKLDQIKEVRFSYEGSYQVTFEVAGQVGECWVPTDPRNRHHQMLLEYFRTVELPTTSASGKAPAISGHPEGKLGVARMVCWNYRDGRNSLFRSTSVLLSIGECCIRDPSHRQSPTFR